MKTPKPTTTARRHFIRNAAILAPAITLFPSWLTASTGSRLRIAFIGAGQWGQQYLQTALLHKGIEVKAICEHDGAALQQTKQIFKTSGIALPALYKEGATAYKELLARTDIDAVIIATPWHTHYEIAKAALLAGKHVACGAIMGSTVEEHWDIVNTSKQTGKQYVTLDELSYRRDLMAIGNMVKEGKLGELQSIHAGAAYSSTGEEMGKTFSYPVYPAAATAQLLGISAGNRYVTLSVEQQRQDYVLSKTNAKTGAPYFYITRGLVSTINLGTSSEQSVILQSNFNSDRKFSTGFRLQATGGNWMDISKQVNFAGKPSERIDLLNTKANKHIDCYRQQPAQENVALALHDLVKTVQQPAGDHFSVCTAATNSVIGTLANESVQKGGATIQFPNFFI